MKRTSGCGWSPPTDQTARRRAHPRLSAARRSRSKQGKIFSTPRRSRNTHLATSSHIRSPDSLSLSLSSIRFPPHQPALSHSSSPSVASPSSDDDPLNTPRFVQPASFYKSEHSVDADAFNGWIGGSIIGPRPRVWLSPEDDEEAQRGIPIFEPTMEVSSDAEIRLFRGGEGRAGGREGREGGVELELMFLPSSFIFRSCRSSLISR